MYIFCYFQCRKPWEDGIYENKKKCRAGAKCRVRWDQNHLIFFTWPKQDFLTNQRPDDLPSGSDHNKSHMGPS